MAEGNDKGEPEVHVDEDWKSSVRDEKQRLKEEGREAAAPEGEARAARRSFPEPSIPVFLAGLYTQTLIALGEIENPLTGKKQQSPDEAEYLIDTIALLQEKTEGNLEPEESAYVQNVLTDLRVRYVNRTGQGETSAETPEPEPQT